MAGGEFDLIRRWFAQLGATRNDVAIGVGDDAALLRVPIGHDLVVTADTMVAGVHFPLDTAPEDIGHKLLAVNLSDLAAMGAAPAWVTLALTLPEHDEAWLRAFSAGFHALAIEHDVALVGGDTTRGPLTLTVQAHGLVPAGSVMTRACARPGDLIYLTGTVGDAGLALLALQDELRLPKADRAAVLARLNRPTPRVAAGQALRGIASAAIDVSDGVAADLGHILERSGVGATVYAERLPISAVMGKWLDAAGGWALPLSAGDDYELLVTIPESRQAAAEAAMAVLDCAFTWIGMIDSAPGLRCQLDDGTQLGVTGGYDHFGS
ncbi:MAG: thiamine-phosphate kinase [Chromatiales bacterium]|nr:thiamine-phosphate kinase [Gammaproteobacteria bacterium]MCP5351739.1 thiamine-phosphate kinase [Chromatiales bacterium]